MRLYHELINIYEIINDSSFKKLVDDYNKFSIESNEKFKNKLIKVKTLYKESLQSESTIKEKKERIAKLEKQYHEKEQDLVKLKKAVDDEAKVIEFNKKINEAYSNVIKELNEYVNQLPIKLADNLSDKIKEYYNLMNQDDAKFELIDNLSLPMSSKDKIIIKMKDGVEQDALQILSEGHVRILGLAILLAKAVYEENKFLIFDDIVNAIDDDHRDGVAKLLITNKDFVNMQMILTCHGELFLTRLEQYVINNKQMQRYMFLPADTHENRGVFIKYQDSSIPLKNAREFFDNNELKNCAAKCRQALECIVPKLWNKIAKYGEISVSLRKLNQGPDLYSAVSSLSSATKNRKIKGASVISDDLKAILDKPNWDILNKGTHVDSNTSEFPRSEVKVVLELIEKLAVEVDNLKVVATTEDYIKNAG